MAQGEHDAQRGFRCCGEERYEPYQDARRLMSREDEAEKRENQGGQRGESEGRSEEKVAEAPQQASFDGARVCGDGVKAAADVPFGGFQQLSQLLGTALHRAFFNAEPRAVLHGENKVAVGFRNPLDVGIEQTERLRTVLHDFHVVIEEAQAAAVSASEADGLP